MAALKHLSDRVMHLLHAFRIQVRSRFVEQQQSGMHGKHASQCQPLTLAAGQPTCGMIRAHVVQAHDVKGLTHPLPDGVSSEAEILAAEHAGQSSHQRTFAGTGCAKQQYALPRLDFKIDMSQREILTRSMSPSPVNRLHTGCDHGSDFIRRHL